MVILLLFAFLAGLTTILAPCIWPLLPIILSSSTTGGHRKPLGITLGIMLSFSVFTLSISYLVMLFHFDPNILRTIAAITIAFLGLTMIVPALLIHYEMLISRLSSFISQKPVAQHHGFFGGFITGLSLGIVWSPCAGPILATIATLGATQHVSFETILVTIAYVFGVGIPLFLFSFLGAWLFKESRFISSYTIHLQKLFGVITILTAVAIYTNYDKVIQVKLLTMFPSYSSAVNNLENNDKVKKQLDILKGEKTKTPKIQDMFNSKLSNFGQAPDFIGITNWIGSKPLTIQQLQGKVVLVDFWTYTCINCIRTLPHVVGLYEKYKDDGFVIVGVHTPEFEFEKKTENVENAIKMYGISYPVAQDNNYTTWQAYNNQYWPAKYLIDAKGNIRYVHFGEGNYEETEKAVQQLLKEKGSFAKEKQEPMSADDLSPKAPVTPETYLGKRRMERFTKGEFLLRDQFSYKGVWDVQDERAIAGKGVSLFLHFYAKKVFLVVTPQGKNDKAKIYLDNKIIDESQMGEDVKNGEIIFDTPRLYELINLSKYEDHILRIDFETPGTSVYAFTFG